MSIEHLKDPPYKCSHSCCGSSESSKFLLEQNFDLRQQRSQLEERVEQLKTVNEELLNLKWQLSDKISEQWKEINRLKAVVEAAKVVAHAYQHASQEALYSAIEDVRKTLKALDQGGENESRTL